MDGYITQLKNLRKDKCRVGGSVYGVRWDLGLAVTHREKSLKLEKCMVYVWVEGCVHRFLRALLYKGSSETNKHWESCGYCEKTIIFEKFIKQAGGELCQAQVKLEVIVYVVEEGWSWRCNLGWG